MAFFRSRALDFNKLLDHWLKLLMQRRVITTHDGAVVLIGDGLKVAKEAKLMPGVKKLHQDSENSGKAPWISGHHFGVVGILMGNDQKMFCVPAAAELREGVTALRVLQRKDQAGANLGSMGRNLSWRSFSPRDPRIFSPSG